MWVDIYPKGYSETNAISLKGMSQNEVFNFSGSGNLGTNRLYKQGCKKNPTGGANLWACLKIESAPSSLM